MTRLLPRRPHLRLDPESYRQLCQQVLQRDGWRCQSCGRCTNLQVHHIHPRGRLGDDTEANLITLCATCHRDAHLRKPGAAHKESHKLRCLDAEPLLFPCPGR